MAIHPDYPGLEAAIVVGGEALPEHQDDEGQDRPNEITRYVEATSEAFFAIRYTMPAALFAEHSVLSVTELDGQQVRSIVSYNEKYRSGRTFTCATSFAHVDGIDMGQKFRFSEVCTSEASQAIDRSLKKHIARMGLITISFYAINNLCHKVKGDVLPSLRNYDTVPEKALKGSTLSHSAQLGPLQPIAREIWYGFDYVDRQPFAVFHFKYRSLAALKSLHIVPRTPSPTPLEARPTEDLSAEELAELVNRYRRADQARAQRIKEENTPRVKREREAFDRDSGDEIIVTETRSRKRQYLSTDADEVIVLD